MPRISMKQVRNHLDFDKLPDHIRTLSNSAQINWHLTTNSYTIPMCDHCGKNYTKWDNTLKSYRTFCSTICATKSETTNKKRLEASNSKSDYEKEQSKNKRKKTLIEKYGENYTEVILDKSKKTMIDRYGVEYSHQNSNVREKFTDTMNSRYGVSYAMQSDDLKESHKNSVLSSLGVESPLMSPEVREKRKETMIDRYNTEFPLQCEKLKQKYKKTSFDRYGCDWPVQYHIDSSSMDILQDADSLDKLLKSHNTITLGDKLGVDPTTISNYIKYHGIQYQSTPRISAFENSIESFLQYNGIEYQKNNRALISPYEIDFYIPEYNIGIECNGVYWHSDKFKSDKYHYNKWQLAQSNNVRLVQISETDYNEKTEIFHNMILSLLHRQPKGPGGRKCNVRKISGKIAIPFLKKYHIQGSVNGDHYGAYHENILIAVMTIGYTRGSVKNRRKELKRWVTDNRTHPGLFSKVLSFILQDQKIHELVSFSMNDWFTGEVYEKSGFVKGKIHKPGYRYLWKNRLVHASNFTKSEIRKKFVESKELLDNGATEKQVMDSMNILRVWDAGKTEWTLKRT